MSDCNKQIRSFVLGIIVWGIVTILLKMNNKSEAFTIGSKFDDHDNKRKWDWQNDNWWKTNEHNGSNLGSGSGDIPGWGSGGYNADRIDNQGELLSAKELLSKIGSSTDEALNEIQRALQTYESERSLAAQDIGSRIEEDRAYAQEMITALDSALHDAGISIRQRRQRLQELYDAIKQMAQSGSIQWDEIRRMLHDGVGHPANHTTPDRSQSTPDGTGGEPGGEEGFRQKRRESFRQKRKVSKRVPLPSIALTSLGN